MTRRHLGFAIVASVVFGAMFLWASAPTMKKTYEIRDEFTTIAPTCGEVAGAITGYADAQYQGTVTVKGCRSIRKATYSPTAWVARVLMAGEYDSRPLLYSVYLQYSPFVVTNIGPPSG